MGGPPKTPGEPPPAPLALRSLLTSQHHRRCAGRPRWLHGMHRPQSSARPCLQKESTVSPQQGGQPGPGSGAQTGTRGGDCRKCRHCVLRAQRSGSTGRVPDAHCRLPSTGTGAAPQRHRGWRNCRSSDKQHQSHPSEKHASGRGTSCALRTALSITGRGPRAGSQTGLCRQTGTRTEVGTEPHHCPGTC